MIYIYIYIYIYPFEPNRIQCSSSRGFKSVSSVTECYCLSFVISFSDVLLLSLAQFA